MVRFGAIGLSRHDIDAIRQEAMQFAGMGLLTIGLDGTIIYTDRGMLRIFDLEDRYPDVVSAYGLIAGDILGCPDVLTQLVEDAKVRGRVHALERRIQSVKGASRWVLCDAYGLPASGQPFEAVQIMMRDISSRKRAQHHVARLNECFLGFSPDPEANIDRLVAMVGEVLSASCAMYNRLSGGMLRMVGQWRVPEDYGSSSRPEGRLCYDVIKRGGDEPLVVRDLPSTPYALSDPHIAHYGFRTCVAVAVQSADRVRGALSVVSRLDWEPSDDDLALLKVAASAIGIEETQALAHEMLVDREETYHSIMQQSLENIYILDSESGRVLETNRTLQVLLGYTEEELRLLRAQDFVAHDPADIMEKIQRVRSEGQVYVGDRTYRRKDGSLVDVEVTASLVRYGGGDALAVVSRDVSERNRAIRALQESEAKYRSLVEESLQGIVLAVGPVPRLVFANQAMARILGYTTDELLGLSPEGITALVHPDDREPFFQRFADRLSGKDVPSRYEVRGIRKEGATCWLDISSTRVEYCGAPAVQAMFVDVTAHKEAEESLRHSEARYRLTLESIRDPVHVVDRDMRIVLFNSAFRAWNRRLGLSLEVIGRKLFDVFPFLSRSVVDEYEQVAASAKPMVTQERNEVSGQVVITETTKIPVLDADEVISVVTVIRDITERARAEAELRQSEERFREMAELLPEIVAETDLQGRLVFVNRRGYEATGYEPEDFDKGLGMTELIVAGQRQGAREEMGRVLRGEPREEHQYTILRKDGTTFPAMVKSAAIYRDGEPVGIRAVVIDVTDRVRLEEQRRQGAKMEAIGQLAGGIAHDFNNLLTGILGYASVLSKEFPEDSKAGQAARTIEATAERAAELTRQLVGFARCGAMQMVPVDLHGVIDQVVALLSRTLDPAVKMSLGLKASRATVMADPAQMHQVLLNLGLNARDAMPGGGELVISTEVVDLDEGYCRTHMDAMPGPWLLLSVTDTGHGIPKDIQERVFEPFFTTKEPGLGSGMGLATVYGIVHSHGGRVEVYSEPGEGATFKVYLPLADAEPVVEPVCGVHAPVGHGRIMVVDDEKVVLAVAKDILIELGYDVLPFSDGEAALEFYRREHESVDLVIIDLVMPGMDGRACFAAMKAMNPGVRGLLSTGFGMNGRVQQALEEGMVGFVQKPYRLAELARAVSDAMTVLEGENDRV